MNTRTFKTVDTEHMQREFEERLAAGREPDTYIPISNETRQQRLARELAAEKALRKMRRRNLTGKATEAQNA